ncbi:MAG TPA: hypothetical protein VJM34_08495 [Novosphingobium sp.]|nr:hypothetical protein [Novosphingobium sp.]
MRIKSVCLTAAIGCATWALPVSAQEYHAAYHVYNRSNGALLVKESGYESGSILEYSFECIKGRKGVSFRYFEDPANKGPDSEGVDYESLMPFSVTGLRYGKGCDRFCQGLRARLRDPGDKPPGYLFGRISWSEFGRGTQSDIKDEPRPPHWPGHPNFAKQAKGRIAYFKKRCGAP